MDSQAKRAGSKLTRGKIARLLERSVERVRGYRFQNLEPLIAAGLELGEGARVLPRAYIDPTRPWLITIGAGAAVSQYVKVLTHDDSMKIQTGFTRIGPVEIGKRVFVGNSSIILPGTRIGDNSIIGAGAVVSGEIPPGSVVVGHPGRVSSTVSRLQAWQRRAMADAPIWPMEGWTIGVTDDRKARQREALATVREGYSRDRNPRRWGARAEGAEWVPTAGVGWRDTRVIRVTRRAAARLRGELMIERWLREGLQLGEGAVIAEGAALDAWRPWLITIGAGSYVSPHVVILTHDAGLGFQGSLTRIGRVDIGSRVYVGPGAMLLPGSQVGDDSIVEAGAVVRGTIHCGSYVAGNPAAVVSDTASIAEECRRAAASGPSWPDEGCSGDEVSEERKRVQREALSSAPAGFLLPASELAGDESRGSS
jgi:maltose O-acetyltransferase